MTELKSFLQGKISHEKKTAIMGVGSVLRSDDAAGMVLIEKLSAVNHNDDVLLIAGSTAPENFTGVIKDFAPDNIFIVDAAHMGLASGEIRVLETSEIGGLSFSTHMLPLPVMLKYIELEIGCEVIIIGIQPGNTEQGFSMCQEVREGVEYLAELFCEAIQSKGKNG